MTTAQVVETSVTVNNNSPILDYVHPDDQTQPFEINIFMSLLPENKILALTGIKFHQIAKAYSGSLSRRNFRRLKAI